MGVDERIGVLLVHGIGEQKRFQHLEAEVRNFASALAEREEPCGGRVTVQVTPGASSTFQAEKESWCSDRRPPVQVLLRRANGGTTSICFHEVWWADLDEPATFGSQLRFWLWGLSMWLAAGRADAGVDGFRQMRPPRIDGRPIGWGSRLWLRARLLWVATIFATATGSITLWNFLARRFGLPYVPGSRTFVNYLGDVKLYGQDRRGDGGPVYDLGQPPRVAIRRRMVAGLIDVAAADYDRWYVLAHSLGSVVAFNGLMETAHCLPNFIDRHRWCRLLAKGMAGRARTGSADDERDWPADAVPQENARMRPRRPVWLQDDDVIYRDKLFARLRGFLTYGCPLDKFAAIWPALVPLNRLEAVFSAEPRCEWINVYDPTDPVAGALDFFHPSCDCGRHAHRPLKVENYAYKAGPVLLLSHIRYLSYKPQKAGWLIHALVDWVVDERPFNGLAKSPKRWLARGSARHGRREVSQLLQWLGVALAAPAATTVFLRWVPLPQLAQPLVDGVEWIKSSTGALIGWPGLPATGTSDAVQTGPMPALAGLPDPVRSVAEAVIGTASDPTFWADVLVVILIGIAACLLCGAIKWTSDMWSRVRGAPTELGKGLRGFFGKLDLRPTRRAGPGPSGMPSVARTT